MKNPDDITWISTLASTLSCTAWAAALLTKAPDDQCYVGYVFLTGFIQPLVWVSASFGGFAAILLILKIVRSGFKGTFSSAWGIGTLALSSPGIYLAILIYLSMTEILPQIFQH